MADHETLSTDVPVIRSLEDAAFWIGVMHRRTCNDYSEILKLKGRVRMLERTPFVRWWVRRHR